MSTHRKLITVAAASALGLVLAACGGSGGGTTMMVPEPTPQEVCEAADGRWNADDTCTSAAALAVEQQHMAVSDAITAAETAVDGLTAMSTDMDVTAAETAIAAARTALNGADLLSTSQALALNNRLSGIDGDLVMARADIADHRHMVAAEQQRMGVSGAIDAAMAAVGALSDMSTDDEVDAAQALIDAAKTALADANLLSANQVLVLNNRLSTIEGELTTAEAAIADHRQMIADQQQRMMDQRMAANTAIDAANRAVAGLSAMSTDDEVEAAKDAIQAAKDAVTAAVDLSQSDRDGLNSRISTIETTLAGTETNIANHRQVVAVGVDVGGAVDAVMALTNMSTDEEVDAAKGLIAAAETALSAATGVLTAEQALMYSRRIADAKTMLATTETAIAAYRKQKEADDESQRVADVAAARMAAMQSYMDADADATKAEEAATEAEATSPGSPGATAARVAATAARNAATAAKAAHDAITDDMTKADADAQATEAATQAGTANSSYMTAKTENDTIQTAASTGQEQQRVRDVADATEAASDAATAARASATAARTAATAARTAANAARDAYQHAMRARTDSANAQTEYMEADAAATAAEADATAAEMAADAAEAAHAGIDAAGSAEDAQTAQMTAETKQGEAADEAMTASTQQMTAETARDDAMRLASVHVIGLLIAANGQDIEEPVGDDSSTPDVNEAMTVAELQAAAAARSADAVDTAAGEADNGEAGTTATATWPGVVDDPDTADTNEAAGSVLMIMVDPEGSGTPMTFRTVAVEDDPETDGTDESAPKTAGNIAGLGDFNGFSISDGTRHAIVFTDRTQDDAPVVAVTGVPAANLVRDPVSGSTVTDLGTRSGTGYTGVTYYDDVATVDENTDRNLAFTGSLTCPDATACSATVNADDTITVEGYVFTGSRDATAAVEAMDEAAQAAANQDYLVFGVWMQDDEVIAEDGNSDDSERLRCLRGWWKPCHYPRRRNHRNGDVRGFRNGPVHRRRERRLLPGRCHARGRFRCQRCARHDHRDDRQHRGGW